MRRIETLIILLALAFYAWFLRRFGLSQVLEYVRLIGWGLLFTIALEAVARFANTLGWRVAIADCPAALGLGELFMARVAGEAIDYVTPSAQLGGQFVMALTVRRKLTMAVGLATVIIASLAEAIGQIGFISAALIAALPFAAHLHHRLLLPIIAGLLIAVALAGGFFYVQLRQPFSHLWKVAARFNVPQLADPEVKAAAAEADAILVDFYARQRGRFALSCLCYLLAWSMGPLEILIYLTLLHQPLNWTTPVLVEALGLLLERATFLIPGKLVSQEGGKALILALLGYPAAIGFAIGFLRRLKELVWVLFGLGWLTLHRVVAEKQSLVTRRARRNLLKMRGAHEGDI
ncbi:MAG TPA: lysylphosphatidylglycerol synthase domain-containing protein [Candidatus Binataceae bacterium]|nr:lysylphosphatidylglycerol synthase domain-containing protein [Candidatus Binataceae bacterium]